MAVVQYSFSYLRGNIQKILQIFVDFASKLLLIEISDGIMKSFFVDMMLKKVKIV